MELRHLIANCQFLHKQTDLFRKNEQRKENREFFAFEAPTRLQTTSAASLLYDPPGRIGKTPALVAVSYGAKIFRPLQNNVPIEFDFLREEFRESFVGKSRTSISLPTAGPENGASRHRSAGFDGGMCGQAKERNRKPIPGSYEMSDPSLTSSTLLCPKYRNARRCCTVIRRRLLSPITSTMT